MGTLARAPWKTTGTWLIQTSPTWGKQKAAPLQTSPQAAIRRRRDRSRCGANAFPLFLLARRGLKETIRHQQKWNFCHNCSHQIKIVTFFTTDGALALVDVS